MSEKKIINEIQLAHSSNGGRLFRNNVGTGWVGKNIRQKNGDLLIKSPRPLHAGLCKGSSDLIGWTPIEITKDMIGQTLAVFTAVEVKTGKVRITPEQIAFTNTVNALGGKGLIVYSCQEFEDNI